MKGEADPDINSLLARPSGCAFKTLIPGQALFRKRRLHMWALPESGTARHFLALPTAGFV